MLTEILPVQSYLELSRDFLYDRIKGFPKKIGDEESHLPGTFLFAFVSQAYFFSFMAVQAFASEQLWIIWNENDHSLQMKYPKAQTFEHLMNSDLKEVKDQLKVLADLLGIQAIHLKDQILWNDFLQVVKVTRDFLAHSSPNPDKVDKIIGHVFTERDWKFPSDVASKIILHFLELTNSEIPPWVRQNTLFKTLVEVLL
jgi:hypothetical protein